MKTLTTTTIKEQVESATNWMELGSMIYVIDYTMFINGLETEAEAENNAFVYWETTKGIQFQDERSRVAYDKDVLVLANK